MREFIRQYPQLETLVNADFKLKLNASSDLVLLRETTLAQDSYNALSILITFNNAYSNMNSEFKDGKYNLSLSEVTTFLLKYPKTFSAQNCFNLVGSIEVYGVMFRAFLSEGMEFNCFDINHYLSEPISKPVNTDFSEVADFNEPDNLESNAFSSTIAVLQAVASESNTVSTGVAKPVVSEPKTVFTGVAKLCCE